jgi:hypothetical protein
VTHEEKGAPTPEDLRKAEELAGEHVPPSMSGLGGCGIFHGGKCYCSRRERVQAIARALVAEREKVLRQLPAEMQHCTILFKECENGHGRLTATNWIDHGCPTCAERIALDAWKYEAEDWERGVNEFGHPITPDHAHHEVRDWLNDAFATGKAEGYRAGVEDAAIRVNGCGLPKTRIRIEDAVAQVRALLQDKRGAPE